jgi:hypothetical protein
MRTRSEAAEKKLVDDARQLRAWRRWRRERLEALLAGPYAEAARTLLDFLKTMTRPSALIDFVKAGPWTDADANVRAEILALVDAVIIKRREKMGLAPFDDALPGQSLNVFLILREQLLLSSTSQFLPDGGATRGVARFDQADTLKERLSQ